MPKVRCSTCREYVDRDAAIRNGIQSFCVKCGPFKPVQRKKPKKKDVPDDLRQTVLDLDGHRCRFCGRRPAKHLHHVCYRSEGGPHEQSNLITLCPECHDVVHSDKKRYKSLCLGVIWLRSVQGDKQVTVPRLEKRLNALH